MPFDMRLQFFTPIVCMRFVQSIRDGSILLPFGLTTLKKIDVDSLGRLLDWFKKEEDSLDVLGLFIFFSLWNIIFNSPARLLY